MREAKISQWKLPYSSQNMNKKFEMWGNFLLLEYVTEAKFWNKYGLRQVLMSCKLQTSVRDYLALKFFVFAYERFVRRLLFLFFFTGKSLKKTSWIT